VQGGMSAEDPTVSLQQGALSIAPHEQLFLLRIPKQIDLNCLINKKIKKLDIENEIVSDTSGFKNVLCVDREFNISSFRPIVKSKGKGVCVGGEFAGCLNLVRVIDLPATDFNINAVMYFSYFCCIHDIFLTVAVIRLQAHSSIN
jgi:hypothetical protein